MNCVELLGTASSLSGLSGGASVTLASRPPSFRLNTGVTPKTSRARAQESLYCTARHNLVQKCYPIR